MNQSIDSRECCCPPFDPSRWNGKTHNWQEKPFLTDNVVQLFHITLNVGRVVLAKITAGDCNDWKTWMEAKGHAQATIGRGCQERRKPGNHK